MKKRVEGVTVYGIDIGKNSFHVVGLDCTGKPVLHCKFRRDRLVTHFANTPAALIGMESCPGSQWLARKLQESGHTVKIIPAQFPDAMSFSTSFSRLSSLTNRFSLAFSCSSGRCRFL